MVIVIPSARSARVGIAGCAKMGSPAFVDRPPALSLGVKTLLKIAGVIEGVELRLELGQRHRLRRVHSEVGGGQRRLDAEWTTIGDLAGELDRPLECCI